MLAGWPSLTLRCSLYFNVARSGYAVDNWDAMDRDPSYPHVNITLEKWWLRLTGWWFEPLWKILVNWDNYSQYMGKWKMFQTTNQLKMLKTKTKNRNPLGLKFHAMPTTSAGVWAGDLLDAGEPLDQLPPDLAETRTGWWSCSNERWWNAMNSA